MEPSGAVPMTRITSIAALEALYQPAPVAASTTKVARAMTPEYRRLIEASPFAALATVGPEGIAARRAATGRASCAFMMTRP